MSIRSLLIALASIGVAEVRGTELNIVITSSNAGVVNAIPGQAVPYEVRGTLGDTKNDGLARVVVDLEFTGGPLEAADEPSSMPMLNFARPLGISNPNGFGGTVSSGRLIQVGGAQNTIKNPGTNVPFPSGEVILGVGHTSTTLATGSLFAPMNPGEYVLGIVGFSGAVIRRGQQGTAFWKTDPLPLGQVQELIINVSQAAPQAAVAEPNGVPKNRFVSFVVPTSASAQDTAIRVKLTSLHHPAGPPNAPNFAAFEGQYRYLNAFRDGANNPVYTCPDSVLVGSSYKCAKLGCQPEYRDWSSIFGGTVVHVTGDSVLPSSQYDIVHLAGSCVGNEASCLAASSPLTVSTERWGNVDDTPPGGAPNAIDISRVVDKVKDVAGAFIESRCQLRDATPNPFGFSVNAQDIGRVVDAVKGHPYPFTIAVCP